MKNKSTERLLQFASPMELANSLNSAFDELVTSDNFSKFPKKDRVRLVYHWELFRDYLAELE